MKQSVDIFDSDWT